MSDEVRIFEVNLIGLIKTVSCVIPEMIKANNIGTVVFLLSSGCLYPQFFLYCNPGVDGRIIEPALTSTMSGGVYQDLNCLSRLRY